MLFKRVIYLLFLLSLMPTLLFAKDEFDDFLSEINVSAQQDLGGFKSKLSLSFGVEKTKVESVISVSEKPADAYMIFRVAEISQKPVEEVVTVYKKNKNQGWGKIAKELGIKPGSKEFKELKKGKLSESDDSEKVKGKAHKWK
ncbi:MAG: hypothetical protein N2999_01150 [Proteobacteria bacterium]|nr:hypothetical protein [Pseudomonadota bacterium]